MCLQDVAMEKNYQRRNATIHGVSILYNPLQVLMLILTPDWWQSWLDVMSAHLESLAVAPVTLLQLRRYVGVYLRMICNPHDHISDHWRPDFRHPRIMPRHSWEHVHRHRAFSIPALLSIINRNSKTYIDPGTDFNIDELQSNFAGQSSVLNFNPNKPHKWGHLFWLAATRVHRMFRDRSYIYHALARHPQYKPTTTALMRDFSAALPPNPVHIVADSYYNSTDVRDLLNREGRVYTMACNVAWLPHVF
jgi:Transposase IS4